MEAPNGPDDTSWWGELVNAVKPQQGQRLFGFSSRSWAHHLQRDEVIHRSVAHAVMNADKLYGFDRQTLATTALPIEASAKALNDPATRAAYDSSMKAAVRRI